MAGIDSITYGFGDATVIANGAWRHHLNGMLKTWYKSDPLWCGDNPALGKANCGNKMIGTSGQRIDNILNTYDPTNQFADWYPDCFVSHGGTNDMTQLNSGAWVGGSVALSIANYMTLMDLYRAACPLGIFVACKIIPNTTAGSNTNIIAWNAALAVAVAARSDKAFIIIPDCYTAFTNNATWDVDYMYDGTHENDTGALVIATTIYNAMVAALTMPGRGLGRRKRNIKPHKNSLRYAASTVTLLGTDATLDSTKPWAVAFEFDMSRNGNSAASVNSILGLKTDQATAFGFSTLGGTSNRGIEMGSNSNFTRLFPLTTTSPGMNGRFWKGWHMFHLIYDGVSKSTLSSYKLVVDGVKVPLASGSGLASLTNQNGIGAAVFGGTAGTFDMSTLAIWSGGKIMTVKQAEDFYFDHKLPTGPTLTRFYEHKMEGGSGSVLIDTTGNQNGTIGTATWSTNVPTQAYTTIAQRVLARPRGLYI